jgi:hypothetical protein
MFHQNQAATFSLLISPAVKAPVENLFLAQPTAALMRVQTNGRRLSVGNAAGKPVKRVGRLRDSI